MNSQEFSVAALLTEKVPTSLHFSRGGLLRLLQAGVEMANIIDQVKKTMIYDKPFDADAFRNSCSELTERLHLMSSIAHRIAIPEDTVSALYEPNLRLVHGAIGMYGEAGELLEAMSKQLLSGQLDLVNVAEETADSDWYKNLIHSETGITEEQSRAAVISKLTNKLTGRYKDGFTNEAALDRDVVAERILLETSVVIEAAAK